ncbi:Casein kinase I isoform delta [Perkinsus olseni]|uniref:Casein kinase I isoform delta n=1 Tax=Perkinsus olseni TaxID=32597 RepID=A0A7J6KYW2_PEROL|nr:Casein kinase I isoform delta [Perkinsus olseni]
MIVISRYYCDRYVSILVSAVPFFAGSPLFPLIPATSSALLLLLLFVFFGLYGLVEFPVDGMSLYDHAQQAAQHSTGISHPIGPQLPQFFSRPQDPAGTEYSVGDVYVQRSHVAEDLTVGELREEVYDLFGDLGLKLENLSNQISNVHSSAQHSNPPAPSVPVVAPSRKVPDPLIGDTTETAEVPLDNPRKTSSLLNGPTRAPVIVDSNFQERVLKIKKANDAASLVDGGKFLGMGDPRGLMIWAQSVRQTSHYRFGCPISRYFYVLRNLSDTVADSTLCAIELQHGGTPLCERESDFESYLQQVWDQLCREHSHAGSGLIDYFQALRNLKLEEPGYSKFEAHLARFRSLVRAIQSEKGSSLGDDELAAFWLSSLTLAAQQDIKRAPRQEVRSFALMCERARGFYHSRMESDEIGKNKQVNVVQSVPNSVASSSPAPVQASSTPVPTSSRPSPPVHRPALDPTAEKPVDSCADPAVFCLDFLRRFRCQRCLSHQHGTSTCPEVQVAFLHLRCHQCGVHHDRPVVNPTAHCADIMCHRCGEKGHMGRACPTPQPRKRPRVACAVTVSQPEGAPKLNTLPVKVSTAEAVSPGAIPPACSVDGLLDSGCELALVSQDELRRWQSAGVSVPVLQDGTTLLPFDGGPGRAVLGRCHVRITLDDDTTLPLSVRVVDQLSYPLILPLHILRLAGGAVWVISENAKNDDTIFLRPQLRGLLRSTVDPGDELKQLGLGTCTTDNLDNVYRANYAVADPTSDTPESPDDYFDLPHDPQQLLPVSLVPDASAPDGRPSIAIPWKSADRPPPNYHQARARDASIHRRLSPEQYRQYEACVDALITDDIAALLTGPPDPDSYHIPAVPVFKDSLTTPVRICLDARVLNSYIKPISVRGRAEGSLWFYLIGWRTCSFYQACDLSQAFLRVHLASQDQPYVSSVVCNRRIRYKRVAFGVSSSPFGLHSVMSWHKINWQKDVERNGGKLAQAHPLLSEPADGLPPSPPLPQSPVEAPPSDIVGSSPRAARGFTDEETATILPTARVVSTNPKVPRKIDIVIYVDDYYHRGKSFPQVVEQHKYTTWRLRRHGADSSEEKAFNNASPSPAGNYRGVLGYSTDVGVDTVCFNYPDPVPSSTPTCITRRQAVSLINRYYDPLSLFMEGSAPARFILADINASTDDWDALCTPEHTAAIYEWLRTVNSQLPVPRFIDVSGVLNVFADASQLAFCIDIRGPGPTHTRLCGRYGLFPLPQRTNHTIVQKELCSLHLALQLLTEVDQVFCEHGPRPLLYSVYTDSEINLCRLRQDPKRDDKLGKYERRRLRLIREEVSKLSRSGVPVVIRHIRGDCNPSDTCTRRPTSTTTILPKEPAVIDQGKVNIIQATADYDDFVTVQELRDAQDSCDRVRAIRVAIEDGKDPYHKLNDDGLVIRNVALDIETDTEPGTAVLSQILVADAGLQRRLAQAAHQFSHRGRRGTLNLLRRRYFWRKMSTTVRQVCDSCEPCQRSKFDRIARCTLGSTVPWSGYFGAGRICTIDFVGPFSQRDANGNLPSDHPNYGVTLTDLATSYTRGVVTTTKATAEGMVSGVHKDIHSYMRVTTVAHGLDFLEDWPSVFFRAIRVVNTCPYVEDGHLCPHDMHYIHRARIPPLEPVDTGEIGQKLYGAVLDTPSLVPQDVYQDVAAIRKQRWAQFNLLTRKLTWKWRGPYVVKAVSVSIATVSGKNGLDERVYLGNCRRVYSDEDVHPDAEADAEDEGGDLMSVDDQPIHNDPMVAADPAPDTPMGLSRSLDDDIEEDTRERQALARSKIGLDLAIAQYDDDGDVRLKFGRVVGLEDYLMTVQLYTDHGAVVTSPVGCLSPTVTLGSGSDAICVYDLRSSTTRIRSWRLPPTRNMMRAIESL